MNMKSDVTAKYQALEVAWYQHNGRHPLSRISVDAHGNSYVIGDQAWNRRHFNHEFIEMRMRAALEEHP